MTQHEEYTLASREAAQLRAASKAARDARIHHLAREGLTVAEIRRQTGFSHGVVARALATATAPFDGEMAPLPTTRHGGEATR